MKEDIFEWNNKYPWDYLWRRKYNVPFGSPKHLKMDFINMFFDIYEELLFKSKNAKKEEEDEEFDNFMNEKYEGLLKPKSQRKPEEVPVTDDDFNNLDLSQFN